MNILQIFLIGVGLAMDAFAVSICRGLGMRTLRLSRMLLIAFFFGSFQALMPAIGYFIGASFEKYIIDFDHWIAFGLLFLIGGKMILDVIFDKEEDKPCGCCDEEEQFSIAQLLLMAIATSIDALAAGITLPTVLGGMSIGAAVLLVGLTTFILCFFGVMIGNRFGAKYKDKATLAGGIVLILIGTNILSKHLFGIGL